MSKNEKVPDPVGQAIRDYETDLHRFTTIFRGVLYLAGSILAVAIGAIILVLTT